MKNFFFNYFLNEDFMEYFDDFFSTEFKNFNEIYYEKKDNENITYYINAVGLSKNDIEIEIHKNEINIIFHYEKDNILKVLKSSKPIKYTIKCPEDYDVKETKVKLENGILIITVPISKDIKNQVKKIEIE